MWLRRYHCITVDKMKYKQAIKIPTKTRAFLSETELMLAESHNSMVIASVEVSCKG